MAEFTIRIAGCAIGIRSEFGSTMEYFRAYLTQEAPVVTIGADGQDRRTEQRLLDQEADEEGLRRRVFAEPFLERAVLQRKAARALLERGVLLLHGSTVAVDGRAYLFTAPTGVGKSTHTRLWREHFGSRAAAVNDDRTFLLPAEDGLLACGSPWSGKHGLDTNLAVPLAGICLLERGPENRILRIPAEEALPELYHQAFVPVPEQQEKAHLLVQQTAQSIPLYRMACNRTPEAAQTAYTAMCPQN